ncbi:MAG: phosphate/phosphite/phosphonate ABC transporter substrate-binding protein [Gammaproteobacteria bacterium]
MSPATVSTCTWLEQLLRLLLPACTALLINACDARAPQDYQPTFSTTPLSSSTVYRFGIHPLHNPNRLHEIFDPLMELLNQNMGHAKFKLEASRNYAAYDEKLYAGEFHFALPNPFQTINALRHGYRVFGKMGDDENFRGIILVRKDSDLQQPVDLKGKAVSFPAATALAATMMPQYYLQQHGLKVMQDIKIHYVGSQESSIMNVYLGNSSAAATWPPPWRALSKERPELAEALHVKWQTRPLPNNSLMVRKDIPESVVKQVADVLFHLHTHATGQAILARMELSAFEAANDASYAPVVDFVEKFHREVRPVK